VTFSRVGEGKRMLRRVANKKGREKGSGCLIKKKRIYGGSCKGGRGIDRMKKKEVISGAKRVFDRRRKNKMRKKKKAKKMGLGE